MKAIALAFVALGIPLGAAASTVSPLVSHSAIAVAQCDGSAFNGGTTIRNQLTTGPSSDACSTSESEGSAAATAGELKVFSSTNTTAPLSNDYSHSNLAWAAITDSVLVTPDDSNLIGMSGIFEMEFVIDGTLLGNAGVSWMLDELVEGPNGTLVAEQVHATITEDEIYYPPTGESKSYSNTRETIAAYGLNYEAGDPSNLPHFDYVYTVTAAFDVIFGEYVNYNFAIEAYSGNWFGADGTSDFANTATIAGFGARDLSGSEISASFSTVSGFDPAGTALSTVPLPATGWLLAIGLVAIGLVRRKLPTD